MYPPQQPPLAEPYSVGSATAAPSLEPIPEIFIGRIPPGVSKEQVEVQFAPYGATNFRVLEGKGCAFCSFSTWAAAETAVQALNGLKLDPSVAEGINVKFADVKGAPKGRAQNPKVFIGNINPAVTEDMVREACSQFGFVTNAKIFARSADAKPCAFVTFTSFSEAEFCISALNGMEHSMAVEGKVLNVRLADALSRNAKAGLGVPASAAQLAMPINRVAATPFIPLGPQLARPGGNATGPKVFIGGLPEVATEDFVWGMMAPYGDVTEAKIHRKAGAKPCGFVRFAQPNEADHAISMLGDNGRYTIRRADDNKGVKRPPQAAFPMEAYP